MTEIRQQEYEKIMESAPKSKYIDICLRREYDINCGVIPKRYYLAVNGAGIGAVESSEAKIMVYDLQKAIDFVDNFNAKNYKIIGDKE